MIFTVVILFCSISIVGSVWFSYRIMARPDGQYLLGASLPAEAITHPEVLGLTAAYKKKLNRFLTFMVLIHIPVLFFINWYTSVFVAIYTLWCGALFLGASRLSHWGFLNLHHLKEENGWKVGDCLHLVTIDTELSRCKDRMPFHVLWMLPALVLCLLPHWLFFSPPLGPEPFVGFLVTAGMLGTELMFLWLYFFFCRGKAVVYSEQSDINLICNRLTRRSWSICWIGASYIHALSYVALAFGISGGPTRSGMGIIIFLLLQMILGAGLIFTVFHISRRKQEILLRDTRPVMKDEDEYRIKGYYCNPDNPKLFVTIPGSSNIQLNRGKPAGRFLAAAGAAGISILLLGIITLFAAMDFIPFDMKIGENELRISAPMYGTSLDLDEIRHARLGDRMDIPLNRTSGAGTAQYLLGHFRSSDGTKYQMYYYRESSPFIQIETAEGIICFNAKDPRRTRTLFQALQSALSEKIG